MACARPPCGNGRNAASPDANRSHNVGNLLTPKPARPKLSRQAGRSALETVAFIGANLPQIGQRAVQHVVMVGIALLLGTLIGVPSGLLITRSRRAAALVLYVASVTMTIPSVALFGLLIPLLSPFGYGIGTVPAVVALTLYSLLPIIRNTYTAIMNVDPALREAAIGMGMSGRQRLSEVELPIALPVIITGLRNASALTIGIGAIATYIGAGGLGGFISRGISQTDSRQLVTGALAVSLLAICADWMWLLLQARLTSPGLRVARE